MRFTEGQWVTFKLHNKEVLGWVESCDNESCTLRSMRMFLYKKSLDLVEAVEEEVQLRDGERYNLIDESLRTKDGEWFKEIMCKGERV